MYIWNIANSKGGLCDVEGIWGGWARNTGGAGVGGRVKCELLLGASRAVNSVNSDGWVQNTSNPKICCKNRTRTYLTRLGKTWTYKTVCGIGSARMNECKTFRGKKGTWSLKKKKIPSLLASIGCNSVKTKILRTLEAVFLIGSSVIGKGSTPTVNYNTGTFRRSSLYFCFSVKYTSITCHICCT